MKLIEQYPPLPRIKHRSEAQVQMGTVVDKSTHDTLEAFGIKQSWSKSQTLAWAADIVARRIQEEKDDA